MLTGVCNTCSLLELVPVVTVNDYKVEQQVVGRPTWTSSVASKDGHN